MRGKRHIGWEIASWLLWLGGAVLVALLVRQYLFTFVVVDGSSMERTLSDGDVLAVSIVKYHIGKPERGDVVVCDYPGKEEHYVKRIIGLPGEEIEIMDGVVSINGMALSEPYIAEEPLLDLPKQIVPESSYFVMGDNRNHSNDSRSVGPIEEDLLMGKAFAVAWPLRSIRAMHNTVALAAEQEEPN